MSQAPWTLFLAAQRVHADARPADYCPQSSMARLAIAMDGGRGPWLVARG